MIYRFHDYELDDQLYQLCRHGQHVKLEPKVFSVLAYLLHHRDRVVSRAELQAQLWPGQVLSADALTRCILAARKAVGDDRATQPVITTQHGLGYRFAAAVTEHSDESTFVLRQAQHERSLPPFTLSLSNGEPVLALPDKPSTAVLPFTNMSGDPEQEYFSDGLTEDLITDLSKLSGLFVIASRRTNGTCAHTRRGGRHDY